MINKSIAIEVLVSDYPDSVKYLISNRLWGDFESVCKEKGFPDIEIDGFLVLINKLII